MINTYTAQYPVDKNGEFLSEDEWTIRYLDKSIRAYIQPWIEYNDSIENYLMSTEQMRFAKRICKKNKFALFNGQKTFLPVSDVLIDYLNRFADTCRKSIVQVFLPNTKKKLAPEQFKNAAKVLRLLRF